MSFWLSFTTRSFLSQFYHRQVATKHDSTLLHYVISLSYTFSLLRMLNYPTWLGHNTWHCHFFFQRNALGWRTASVVSMTRCSGQWNDENKTLITLYIPSTHLKLVQSETVTLVTPLNSYPKVRILYKMYLRSTSI